MKKHIVATWAILFTLIFELNFANAQNEKNIELSTKYFNQLDSICTADNGQLWGINLYGPTMFVVAENKQIYANMQANNNSLSSDNKIFTGKLPENINLANTSFKWEGEMWTMVLWNAIPENDQYERNKLLIHESWHRIQNQLGIPAVLSQNTHLDQLKGSTLLKLELTVLKQALLASKDSNIKASLNDALTIRKYRQLLFPSNNENQFERHEGMAEYTGYKLCGLSNDIVRMILAKKTDSWIDKDGLTNSFAYITGPAYGFLFDKLNIEWLPLIKTGKSVPEIGISITNTQIENDTTILGIKVKNIINRYNAEQLVKNETDKFKLQKQLIAKYKETILNGNQLIIPNNNINFSYNPQEPLIPIDSIGVVYKTMRLVANWGILEVRNGILRTNNWKAFIINAPKDTSSNKIEEVNYTLTLNENWKLIKVKEGIFTIKENPF